MKILLVSDIHLGIKQNSELFIYNTKDFFLNQISNEIKKSNIDQLWVLGDLFDCRNNTNVLVNNVSMQIFSVLLETHKNLKVKILAGNHDIYYKNTLDVSSLKIFKRFHKNLEIIQQIKDYDLDGCKTLVVPWLIKDSKMYNDFLDICNEPKQYDLCLGHFEINGFEVIKGVVAKTGLQQELFEVFGTVFSGHFHIRKTYNNVSYLGCPYQLNWNDYGEDKGFTIFDTKTKETKFIENTISPRHIKLNLSSCTKDMSLLDSIKGNFSKVIVDIPLTVEERLEWFKKIDAVKPLEYSVIDEYEEKQNEVEEFDIEALSGDCLSIIDEYLKKDPLPSDVSKDDFKVYMKMIHDKSIAEGK